MTELTFQPTTNEWDAPITVTRRWDGTLRITREPPSPSAGDNYWTHYPHAVVLVDGVMSPFDQARQPRREPGRIPVTTWAFAGGADAETAQAGDWGMTELGWESVAPGEYVREPE